MRIAKLEHLRNEGLLNDITGLTGECIIRTINGCYRTLDNIDHQMIAQGIDPIAKLVELANLSSMVGNIVGAGLAVNSDGLYIRNRPHAFPDLMPTSNAGVDLELKMALETNRPKGHLPKAGTYITFRYVLGDASGNYQKGKDYRGDTVWIWEVKVGYMNETDFSCSNTDGDSGKTAVIKSGVHNSMALVYYAPEFLPYSSKDGIVYCGFN
ncbi:hypothetical protein JEQ04_06540 [Serratia plymuthica]|uniref:hypothetical protein n=1 Tax=Serratia TaxID=613 RepID=UPI0018E40063|nr:MULTISPECIES: hypothetical protein [Serratia]MBI6137516.1 hypothetical protein [Serratia plymuthica]CAI0821531.1 Uncharacterised protein [Serratia liquefaciens]